MLICTSLCEIIAKAYHLHLLGCEEEVKNITKMDICNNIHCNLPNRTTERSNTMYCSRCRCVAYCSRECQNADWSMHKRCCDTNSAIMAEWLDDVRVDRSAGDKEAERSPNQEPRPRGMICKTLTSR